MTIVTGKHKELLIELLLYYLTNDNYLIPVHPRMINNIKEQNTKGKEWIEYYINLAY
jgi:hypothetical protein